MLISGCAITKEDIELWKGTVRGPGKIVSVLASNKFNDALRTDAALALVALERPNIDGVGELQAAFTRMDDEHKASILKSLTPQLVQAMESGGDAAEGAPPSAQQIRAKDAAFLLIPFANAEVRGQLTDAVVNWFAKDFNTRSLAGSYSAEQCVRQLGAPAARKLVDAMGVKIPTAALVKIAELITVLGDTQTKEAAGKRIVAIEKEVGSDTFGTWIQARYEGQKKKADPNVKLNPEDTKKVVANYKESFLQEGVLPAMHHLASDAGVQKRLIEIASTASSDAVIVSRRTKALQALEGHVDASLLNPLLSIALNGSTPASVRDYAFDRIGDSGNAKAIDRLWPLASQGGEGDGWRLRWRVGSLILSLGGNGVVDNWLGRLPKGRYAREELLGYGDRLSQVRPAPTALMRAQLGSGEWFKRVIAIAYLERQGTSQDVVAIRRLASDTAKLEGEHWKDMTVGKFAEESVKRLEERLKASK